MPPKFKFTKDEIISAAVDITREQGAVGVTARALAERLNCSVKPIFGLFQNMDEVRQSVLTAAHKLYSSYIANDMSAGKYPPYKASGMAYIRFAREETELFKLLFMRDRHSENTEANSDDIRPLIEVICKNLGISEEKARLFHLEMWVYVHGIATMIATGYLDWQDDFVSDVLTDAYEGLRLRYLEDKYGSD